MSLAPLTSAPLPIQLHAYAALMAVLLGAGQLLFAKGTARHRLIGYGWSALMLAIAVSGLFIHEIRMWGLFSPIHLLSLVILVTVPLAVIYARKGEAAAHGRAMRNIFWLALVVAGLFTLLPGRIFGLMLFGSQ